MIGAKIRKLRLQHGMTQKKLADELFVSAQAVSRWENEEVEPSIGTILELAKIFGVTADELLTSQETVTHKTDIKNEEKPLTDKQEEKKEPPKDAPRQFLAVCEKCNKPIYHSHEIVRARDIVWCSQCYNANETREKANILQEATKRRTRSFIFGTLAAVICLIIVISSWNTVPTTTPLKIGGILFSLSMFTFISCCFLNNNFVGVLFLNVAMWSIKMPGLIFTFDLDGCLWYIGMKILFAIIGFFVGVGVFLLALTLAAVTSIFVYPYAIVTNIKHPENTYF